MRRRERNRRLAAPAEFDFSGNSSSWLKMKVSAYKRLFSGVEDVDIYIKGDWVNDKGEVETLNAGRLIKNIGTKYISVYLDRQMKKVGRYIPVEDGWSEEADIGEIRNPSLVIIMPGI